MPGGDRTGPWGMGPLTGRGMGYCAGYPVPGYANVAGRGGFGARGGRGGFGGYGGGGRGFRNRFYATGIPGWMAYGASPWAPTAPVYNPASEYEHLSQQAEMLQKTLSDIQSRLDELNETKDKPKGK
ncbi:DUF5320 domain-containing protein [bacterium]|nr:DUF5320 domain-containing protein [bacterium]